MYLMLFNKTTLIFRILIFNFLFLLCPTHGQDLLHNVLDILQTSFPDQWHPKGVPDKNDLRCTQETITWCQSEESTTVDACCNCHATPIWAGNEVQLPIEYITVLGATVILREWNANITSVYKIEYEDAGISEIPVNICNGDGTSDTFLNELSSSARELTNISTLWPRIVRIDLSTNNLLAISDLNCLTALDTLDLSFNRITHLSNASFTKLTHLRVVLLHHNRIKSMDSYVIAAKTMHLSKIDLSENDLETLDISNFISENPFCDIDYSGNVIEEITNINDAKLNTSKHYEGGFVSLKGNLSHTFPDFNEILNLDGIEQIGTFLDFRFDFRESSIGCDCVLEPLMEKSKDFVKTYWRDYFDVKCDSPERLKGRSVVNLTLDDFICDLNPQDGCPFGCKCLDIPSQQTLFVDCSYKGMTEFPERLPVSKYSTNINLNLTGNQITSIGNISYLENITNLNLSKNQLEDIDEAAAQALKHAHIDLSNNLNLVSLPQSLQYRNMCSVSMSNIVLECDCQSRWLETWIDVKSCPKSQDFKCRVPGHGLMPAKDFNSDMLHCSPQDQFVVIISVTLASIITP